jgi:putative ATP-dependent endonuclease of the OLD family
LDADRQTVVSRIELPGKEAEAYKFVREAVEAFPELYFARLVVLGEGDSEQIVLPRMLQAAGEFPDMACISVVPLSGRHVHHFWRLLSSLDIPFVTLLDLDVGRYDGGWGRIRYARDQLVRHGGSLTAVSQHGLRLAAQVPQWNDPDEFILQSSKGREWLALLELCGVYFSSPLDLDLAMMSAYPLAYGGNSAVTEVGDDVLESVLGKAWILGKQQYSSNQQGLFDGYRRLFINGSKPAAHLGALSTLSDTELMAAIPESLSCLLEQVKAQLAELPE